MTNTTSNGPSVKADRLAEYVEIPEGATSFWADSEAVHFSIGATGKSVDVQITPEIAQELRGGGMMGTFGWELVA